MSNQNSLFLLLTPIMVVCLSFALTMTVFASLTPTMTVFPGCSFLINVSFLPGCPLYTRSEWQQGKQSLTGCTEGKRGFRCGGQQTAATCPHSKTVCNFCLGAMYLEKSFCKETRKWSLERAQRPTASCRFFAPLDP